MVGKHVTKYVPGDHDKNWSRIPEHVYVILNQIGSLLHVSALLFETTSK